MTPLKDPDTENLDAGWDDVVSDRAPAPAGISAEPAADLEDLDAGWDESPPSAPLTLGRERAEAPGGGAVRRDRLSKRERRELERQMRSRGEKRRAERRAEEKRARKDALRRAAEERSAERREALERSTRLERAERKKRSKERSRSEKSHRSREHAAGDGAKPGSPSRPRFQMPNGGWIIVVIALITLGTAWYAFGR